MTGFSCFGTSDPAGLNCSVHTHLLSLRAVEKSCGLNQI